LIKQNLIVAMALAKKEKKSEKITKISIYIIFKHLLLSDCELVFRLDLTLVDYNVNDDKGGRIFVYSLFWLMPVLF